MGTLGQVAAYPLLQVGSPFTGLNSGLGMEMAGAWCQRATAPAARRGCRVCVCVIQCSVCTSLVVCVCDACWCWCW